MELREKSLQTLELPAVLNMLSHEAICDAAKKQAMHIRPATAAYEVQLRLRETSAAKHIMQCKGSPGFSGIHDIRNALARADMGGMLNTKELLDIAKVLTAARQGRVYSNGSAYGNNALDPLFQSLIAHRDLEERITTSIVAEDEIADAASAELSNIRRQMRACAARARDALQKMISSPAYAKALQEPIITMRAERYVVPVKAEYKGTIQGLVHDTSASGATLFIEPLAAVKANNELRELSAKEKIEIDRILMTLSAECAAVGEDIARDFELLVELDLIFAKARLSEKMRADAPGISEGEIVLKQARHPLLPVEHAVPIDLILGQDYDTMVVTGPNTGGKTVTLKTLGLLSLMMQCGLHVPVAEGSMLPIFEQILADIGDEQSIEQSLSTFSSHMTNIVRILAHCTDRSLILFDELGAGTDPVEGAALAISIIEQARSMGAMIAASTHYAELKLYATSTPGVINASCEFDVRTLQPTYRLLIGVPGKSNAFAIAQRLGLSVDIIEDAKKRIGADTKSFETVLEQLEQQRQKMELQQQEIKKMLADAQQKEQKAAQMHRELTVRLEKADEKARREAARIIEEARETAELVFDELDAMRKKRNQEDWQKQNDQRSSMRRMLNTSEEKYATGQKEISQEESARPVQAGDTVLIRKMDIKATVLEVNPDRSLILQAGIMRVNAREEEVLLLENESTQTIRQFIEKTDLALRSMKTKPEVDLRGMTAEEAIPVMERFLDQAVLGKLDTVTIIHGKGTGVLRKSVSQNLKRNRQVKSYRLGTYGEGEDGVTIVELR